MLLKSQCSFDSLICHHASIKEQQRRWLYYVATRKAMEGAMFSKIFVVYILQPFPLHLHELKMFLCNDLFFVIHPLLSPLGLLLSCLFTSVSYCEWRRKVEKFYSVWSRVSQEWPWVVFQSREMCCSERSAQEKRHERSYGRLCPVG